MISYNKLLPTILFTVAAILLFAEAYLSLGWRYEHDSPLLLYMGYIMKEFHYFPYKDFFDQNMPGSILIHYFIVKFFGFSDFTIRIIDLTLLAILLTNTYWLLKKINVQFALFVSMLEGFGFFLYGFHISLQRELFILVFILTALNILFQKPVINFQKFLLSSFLLGFCIIIKPHSCIVYIFTIVLFIYNSRKNNCSITKIISYVTLSSLLFLFPITVTFLYLFKHDAIPYFFKIITQYWPLYAQLDINHIHREGTDRVIYLIKEFLYFGNHTILLIPVLFCIQLDKICPYKNIFLSYTILTALFSIYPVITGQFWPYHWYMFFFLLLLSASFSTLPLFVNQKISEGNKIISIAFLIFLCLYCIPESITNTFTHRHTTPKNGRVDKIVAYLKSQGASKETVVQALDWTGGAIHAMLITGVKPATRFLEDFYFYHDINNPFMLGLKKEFIAELFLKKPDFFIQINSEDKPWVSGTSTTRDFKELSDFLVSFYKPDYSTHDFTIYKIKASN